MLNIRYFSVKSIMLLFNYFHKSRLFYAISVFIDQKTSINRIDRSICYTIKRMMILPNRTNLENYDLNQVYIILM